MVAALPFDRFLSTHEAVEGFGATALIQHMLDVEAALAKAQADEGIVPASAAAAIAAACRAERFNAEQIVAEGAVAGSVAIALVKALTAAVAAHDAPAAAWVHWGSTSQDVIDTAMVLATRASLARIDAGLERTVAALTTLARTHRDTPMLARTLVQPAQVISVGFKLLAWIAPLVRARRRLHDAAHAALQLQLGGAVGTLATLGDRGGAVVRRVAAELGLRAPEGAWHTQRDDWVALGGEVGVLCGSLGKIALDIGLLAQAEVGEMAEPSGGGRGGSSAMPHKRNPVGSMIVRAVALRTPQRVATLLAAMPQEHERALGAWQAELAEWPQLMLGAEGAVHALDGVAAGLSIDASRMRSNIDALNGLVFAEAAANLFAGVLGKSAAHALLDKLAQACVAERRPLQALAQEARSADPALRSAIDVQALDQAFDVELAARRAGALAEQRLTPRS